MTLGLDFLQTTKGGERGLADDAVHVEPGIPLELADGHFEGGAEYPIHRPAVETEFVQPTLKIEDVVPPHEGDAKIEEPVTGLVAGFHQLGPGVFADYPVGHQEPLLLELPDRHLGVRPEHPVGSLATQLKAKGR